MKHYVNDRATPEANAYQGAKGRCINPKIRCYKHYGARGIEFRYRSFEEFIDDIGPRPSSRHSVDRVNVNGHYEPGNCRWATRREQVVNRRKLSNNTSGFIGVSWCGYHKKWRALISVAAKHVHLGYFSVKEDAARAYDSAALIHHGPEARLNFAQ